jgi:hypothetical protein
MKPCNCIQHCNCSSLTDPGRRSLLTGAAAGLTAAATFPTTPAKAALDPDRRKFMEEATQLRWLRSSEQFPRFDKCHSTGFEGCGNFMRRPRRVAE